MAPRKTTRNRVASVTVRLLPKYRPKSDRVSTVSKPIRLKVSGPGGASGWLKIALRDLKALNSTRTIGNSAITV